VEYPDPKALRKFCQAMADYRGDPAPVLAANPSPRDAAERELHDMLGDKPCASDPVELSRDICEERVKFRAAFAKKSAAGCGDGGICRVLMGEPAVACEIYAAEFKKQACREIYAPRYAADQSWAFTGLVDPVVASLSNAALGDAKAEAEVSRRLDAVFALRERMEAAARRIFPKKKSETTKAGTPP